jgi:hypothetical protein
MDQLPRLFVGELTGPKLIERDQAVLRREDGFESCELCLHRANRRTLVRHQSVGTETIALRTLSRPTVGAEN